MTPPSSPAKSGHAFNMFRSDSGLNGKCNPSNAPLSTAVTAVGERGDDLDLDEMFSFDKLQSLHLLAGQIQDAIHVLGQNKRLLDEIEKYFKSLLSSERFSSLVDLQDYTDNLASFFQGISKILREIDGQQARLQNMLRDLEKNTELFNAILEYRNMRLGEFFSTQGAIQAKYAQLSSDSMMDISMKTRREAVSMHVITIWTLIFLPGTFVATFFSSGILNFGEVSKFGEWGTSWVGLELFFLIACPIMLMTFAGWGYFYYQARAKRRAGASAGLPNDVKDLEAGILRDVPKS